MKIAVCDDLKKDRLRLAELLEKYSKNHKKTYTVDFFNNGNALLQDFTKNKYDIIFLDIYMSGISGIETARKIRNIDKKAGIILTTTSTNFFREGFEVNATHYLIKPLQYEKFQEAMQRLDYTFDTLKSEQLIIQKGADTIRVPQNIISHIETIRNGIKIHICDKSINCRFPISKAEKQLDSRYFLRVHRSYIINMNHVDEIQDDFFIMGNGDRVLIRKKDVATIKHAYATFQLEKLSGDL